jgi:hypothetical protein
MLVKETPPKPLKLTRGSRGALQRANLNNFFIIEELCSLAPRWPLINGAHFRVKKGDIEPKTPIFGTLSYNIQ